MTPYNRQILSNSHRLPRKINQIRHQHSRRFTHNTFIHNAQMNIDAVKVIWGEKNEKGKEKEGKHEKTGRGNIERKIHAKV